MMKHMARFKQSHGTGMPLPEQPDWAPSKPSGPHQSACQLQHLTWQLLPDWAARLHKEQVQRSWRVSATAQAVPWSCALSRLLLDCSVSMVF